MAIMEKYYFLSGRNNEGSVASAFAPEGNKLELIEDLDNVKELPFELELVKLTVEKRGLEVAKNLNNLKSIWLDYQPNSFATPLFSKKFKALIERELTGNEGVNWIVVKVNGNNEKKVYYMLRFEKMLDVLDYEKTLFVEGTDHIIRPCFSLSKINKYSIFHRPSSHNLWKIPSAIYINEELKKKIMKEKITGVSFEKVMVSEPLVSGKNEK